MVARGFKIKDTLALYQRNLANPPSKHTNIQLTTTNIQKTLRLANVRIYVEQAIARMKTFVLCNMNSQHHFYNLLMTLFFYVQ